MRLKGKIALVTGGARGIGLAVTKALVAEGAIPVIADINEQGAREALSTLPASDGLALAVNVADVASVTNMVQAIVDRFGRVDILVNNAGIGGNTPFLDIKLEEWNRTISINLTGAFLVAQACAREMVKQRGGKIVNIASLSGQRGGHGRAAYGAAKAGLELLTKVMAVELAEFGINVNNIAPGAIETEMAKFAHDQATRAAYNYLIPDDALRNARGDRRRGGVPRSDESRYIHGHTLNVDGGFRAAGLMFRGDKAAPGG